MNRYFIPGRIEVLGKHTDYAGGRSILCAIERGITLSVSPRSDAVVHVRDLTNGIECTFPLDPDLDVPPGLWITYVATVVRRLARNFPDARAGADIAFSSDLPPASGLSSSSALVTAIFTALSDVNTLHDHPDFKANVGSGEDLAGYLGAIENGSSFRSLAGGAGVGVYGGSEDHTAILCSRAGALRQYSFAPVTLEREIPLSPELTFVVAYSGVTAPKTGSARAAYNAASQDMRRILRLWNEAAGRSDHTVGAALVSSADAPGLMRAVIAGAAGETPARSLTDRLEQFRAEAFDIIPCAADALAASDYAAFGTLVDRSQRAAIELLQNQVPETIALARLAREHGALAASAFGAGFGGSVWALVRRGTVSEFQTAWADAYRSTFPEAAAASVFFATDPADGVHRL